jgi:peptide deformylase
MAVREILLLGNPELYEPSTIVRRDEIDDLRGVIEDLHDTMLAFRREHGWGRAIAAPQIGVRRRMVAVNLDGEPITLINPVLDQLDGAELDYWEDCMSFPELLVHLRVPRACRLTYRDLRWVERRARLTLDYAALVQHEVDHLDGVLSVMRVSEPRGIALRRARPPKAVALRGEWAAAPIT